jgi:fatty acid-binding protein DegV
MDTIGKTRGRKAALNRLADEVEEIITDPDLPIFIGHGDCQEDAELLADIIRERLGAKNIIISYIGIVCGSHAGPGIIAVFFHGKKR